MPCPNSHDSKLPVSFPDVWTHMRDQAKGTTPLAQFYLNEARTYCPPSKAHKRRILLKRERPIFTRPPKPLPVDGTARSYHNGAAQLGASVAEVAKAAALLERHYICSNEPVRAPSTTNAFVPPVTYGALKDDAWPTPEQIEQRIAQLAADHARAIAGR